MARLTRLAARLLLLALGYSLEVEGREHAAAARRAPVVANAQSYLDALVLTAVLGPLPLRAGAAAAKGGFLARLLGGVEGAPGGPALAFPEPARTAGGCLLPFAPAAFAGGASCLVLPATLAYAAANSFNAARPRDTGALAAAAHAARLTAAWMKRARVQLLPPRAAAPGQDGAREPAAQRAARTLARPWRTRARLTRPRARTASAATARSGGVRCGRAARHGGCAAVARRGACGRPSRNADGP